MRTGNKGTFKTLGSSNHAKESRADNDFYATDTLATKALVLLEKFDRYILEPACGLGHISKVLEANGYKVKSTDLIQRQFGIGKRDFLKRKKPWKGDIITNPPYNEAENFVKKSLELIQRGNKVAMFLKILFLETKSRRELFKEYPPHTIYVASTRIKCCKNMDFDSKKGRAVCYAWFIWVKGYKGNTIIKWFN